MKLSKRLRKWRKNITVQMPLDYMLVLQEDIMGFADEVKALEAENKKLRELVADMWRDGMCECDERGICVKCEYHFPDRMHELGIEAD